MPGMEGAINAHQPNRSARVGVVIVTYNSATTLDAAIASVLGEGSVDRVVVVDNASSDDSAAIAERAGATVVRNSENLGFGRAVNVGLAHLDTDFVLILNPDAVLKDGCLPALLDALARDEQRVLAGPVLQGPDGRICLGARPFLPWLIHAAGHYPGVRRLERFVSTEYPDVEGILRQEDAVPVDWLWGAVVLARRDFLESVGGFDERYFMYSEDEDLGRTARERGLQVVLVPRARAVHIGGVSTGGEEAVSRAQIVVSYIAYVGKWGGRNAAAAYRALTLGGMTVDALYSRLTRRPHAALVNETLRELRGRMRASGTRAAGYGSEGPR